MKKIGTYFILLILLLIPCSVKAVETTDKLYIDVTVEEDGSIFVKEIAVLSGTYNGRLRTIDYHNNRLLDFTDTLSGFEGSKIYNGSSLTDLKIYDIKDKYQITFDSFNNLGTLFKEVTSASSGDYGVYTKQDTSTGIDLKIFNPSSRNSAFYLEYRIHDAVVVHNDVAELYWNLLGDTYEENVTDFKTQVHLPKDDSDLRVWLRGPLYGNIEKLNNREAEVTYSDLTAYESVTVRLMFGLDQVPNATKRSNVLGRDKILAVEQEAADKANQEREKIYTYLVQRATYYVEQAESYYQIEDYRMAMNLVSELKDGDEKENLKRRLAEIEPLVEKELEAKIDNQIAIVKQYKRKEDVQELEEPISYLLDETKQQEYLKTLTDLRNMVEEHYKQMQIILIFLIILYVALVVAYHYFIYYRLDKKIETGFNQPYFREFPYDYNPGLIEYVMKKKVTTDSFSATILELIRKKVIRIENMADNKKRKNYTFILEGDEENLLADEKILVHLLFTTIGHGNKQVTLNAIKDYGNTESSARKFLKEYNSFTSEIEQEANKYNFYNSWIGEQTLSVILTIIATFLLSSFAFTYEFYLALPILIAVVIGNLIYIVVKKYRTKEGKLHFQKWSAHKRFLLDFGRFQEKELPEISLWERYLVTATVLGCADQVEKSMQVQLSKMEALASEVPTTSLYGDIVRIQMLHDILDSNIPTVLASSVHQAVSSSHASMASSNTSSGGGFGGGASFGGGSGGGGGGGGRF